MTKTPVRRRGFLLRKNGNWRRIRASHSPSSTTASSTKRKMSRRSSSSIKNSNLDVQVCSSSPLNPKSLSPDGKSSRGRDSVPRSIVSDSKHEEDAYVIGRRMTRDQSRRMMYKAMDVSAVKALNDSQRRNFMRYKIINAHRSINAVDKGAKSVKTFGKAGADSSRRMLRSGSTGMFVNGQAYQVETVTNKSQSVNITGSCRVTRQKVFLNGDLNAALCIANKKDYPIDGYTREFQDRSIQESSPSGLGAASTAGEFITKLNSEVTNSSKKEIPEVQDTLELPPLGKIVRNLQGRQGKQTALGKSKRIVALNKSTDNTGVSTRKGKLHLKESSVKLTQAEGNGYFTRQKLLLGDDQHQHCLKDSGKTNNEGEPSIQIEEDIKHNGGEDLSPIEEDFMNSLNHANKKKRPWKKGKRSNVSVLLKNKNSPIKNSLDELKDGEVVHDQSTNAKLLGDQESQKHIVSSRRRKRKRCMDDPGDSGSCEINYNARTSFAKDSSMLSLNKENDTPEDTVKNNHIGNDELCSEQLGSVNTDVETRNVVFASEAAKGCETLDMDTIKFDPGSKCCLVATNPTETGGRQMRPRPLDLEQPLLVLVEGQDQDYYELDGGSFYRMFQHQSEPRQDKIKSKTGVRGPPSETGGALKPITIPSFRYRTKHEDNQEKSVAKYAVPNSYIKAASKVKHGQADYDMDEDDEEWLNKYNHSKPSSSSLSSDQFEKIIEILENSITCKHGYAAITKALQDGNEDMFEECCICNGGENKAHNLILQCANCHVRVHKSCYGVQERFMGKKAKNWNCRKCEAVKNGRENADVRCGLCCKQGGALKPSTEPHKWAHVK